MIKDSTQLECYNPPADNFTKQPKNTSSRDEAAIGHPRKDPPVDNAIEQSFDLSNLPPPDLGHMSGEFVSEIQHTNASSHMVVDDNQLIKDGTQLGYRNAPEVKIQEIPPKSLKPVVDTAGYPPVTSDCRPPDQIIPSTTLPVLKRKPRRVSRRRSTAIKTSLSGEVSQVTVSVTGTIKSNQLPVSDHSPVIAAKPLTIPEASQAPPTADSKFGKTNMNILKNKLQHQKEATTETMGQTVGSHPQPSSGVNVESQPQVQGVFDYTNKPTFGKSDLASFGSKVERTKEVTVKEVVATKRKEDHSTLFDITTDDLENAVTPNNPLDKKLVAVPRSTSANLPGSNTHSASSTSSKRSKRSYKLWQCAHCKTVNEVHHDFCLHCKLAHGSMADRSCFCEFCQLVIFIPHKEKREDTICSRCKQVHETVL